jgi:tyrosyl-tRNA synthetase
MPENVIATLRERGFVYQMTETGLEEAAQEKSLLLYCGFDPTSRSLQVGNMVPVMMLAHFQRAGHRPIILVGGGTGMIGDPSGKSAERTLLSPEQVAANAAALKAQLSRFVSFEGENAAIMVDNADWLNTMRLTDFLRDIGKHFTVNAMMAKDSVKSRLENRDQGISFTEFSYMLLQATDFLHLYEKLGCTVQIGGSDQFGNITAGVELVRRKHGVTVHGLTSPLLTTADGKKFGKSEGNAVYLDPELTSPYEMYQFWINQDDRDARKLLLIFTFLPVAEIDALAAEQAENPGARPMQRRLAREFVAFAHGEETARAVEKAAAFLFGGDIADLDEAALTQVLGAVPRAEVTGEALAGGVSILQALVDTGLAASMSAARTLIKQGGVYVNNQRWDDMHGTLTREHLLMNRAVLLRSGRKKYAALVLAK